MLSQLQKLSRDVDGRYATDEELEFVTEYLKRYSLRLETYQKVQAVEGAVVQQVYARMRSIDPTLFMRGKEDISQKWRIDTIRILRYSAIAMLLDDSDTLRERLLLWMQSIMKAFGAQRACRITYEIMQDVIKQHLTPNQANIFCPILEMNRRVLGIV